VGLRDHQTWGLLLLVTLLHGPGALSLDHLIGRRFLARRRR
jgi:putative oxidoreductase